MASWHEIRSDQNSECFGLSSTTGSFSWRSGETEKETRVRERSSHIQYLPAQPRALTAESAALPDENPVKPTGPGRKDPKKGLPGPCVLRHNKAHAGAFKWRGLACSLTCGSTHSTPSIQTGNTSWGKLREKLKQCEISVTNGYLASTFERNFRSTYIANVRSY